MSWFFNVQNNDGNTPLHEAMLHETPFEIVKSLSASTNIRLKNILGRTVFHLAVGHYHLLLEIIELFLELGANVNEVDNQSLSVLHLVFQNPSVNLKAIEKLLKSGVDPDYRDSLGNPPIAYCVVSTLQPHEKQSAEEMLIQYSIIKNRQRDFLRSDRCGDAVICFNFCKDNDKRNKWVSFRDLCIAEVLKIEQENLELNYTLLQFLIDYSCNKEKCLTLCNLKTVLCRLQKNEFPGFRNMLISAIEKCDFKTLIQDMLSLDLSFISSSGMVKNLSLECIREAFEFLPNKDLINFILAFYKF